MKIVILFILLVSCSLPIQKEQNTKSKTLKPELKLNIPFFDQSGDHVYDKELHKKLEKDKKNGIIY